MKTIPKISVIIPMYFCEEYVFDLLNSITSQSFNDFEVICVIDGSTDNTLDYVKQYAARDQRVRYIYKENGGAGSARNVGLDNAQGEYVICIDADDVYSTDLLKKMYNAASEHDADEVMCLFKEHDGRLDVITDNLGFDRKIFQDGKVIDPRSIKDVYKTIRPGPTNKLYKRSLIEENHIRYSTTRVANDVFFGYAGISVARRVVGVHENLITVRKYINDYSITSNRAKHTEDSIHAFSELYNWLKERGINRVFGAAYITSFRRGLHYNARFSYNERFVKETAYVLSREEPWNGFSDARINRNLRLNTDNLKKRIERLNSAAQVSEKDENGDISVQIQKVQNEIRTIEAIVSEMEREYGANFNNSQSRLVPLIWSVEDVGVCETGKRIALRYFKKAKILAIKSRRKAQRIVKRAVKMAVRLKRKAGKALRGIKNNALKLLFRIRNKTTKAFIKIKNRLIRMASRLKKKAMRGFIRLKRKPTTLMNLMKRGIKKIKRKLMWIIIKMKSKIGLFGIKLKRGIRRILR